MAFDAFLKIEGVDGESRDAKHEKWIEILSYSWGVSQPQAGTRSSAGGMTAERADFGDFSVIKVLDTATPTIFLHCASGKHFPKATVELCRAGEDKQVYMEFKFDDVAISSYRPGGARGGQETLPLEEVSFNYGKVQLVYHPTSPRTGKTEGNVPAGWDLEKNVKI
jgi:type VI secretion system secreted protein Hcp